MAFYVSLAVCLLDIRRHRRRRRHRLNGLAATNRRGQHQTSRRSLGASRTLPRTVAFLEMGALKIRQWENKLRSRLILHRE